MAATPESVYTLVFSNVDYAFIDDSHNEEMARALDLTDQNISGEATKDGKKKLLCKYLFYKRNFRLM